MDPKIEVQRFLRRYLSKRHCFKVEHEWVISSELFYKVGESEISFHLQSDEGFELDNYRRAYTTNTGTIPGVIQLSREVFQGALLPVPYPSVDEHDRQQYKDFHCVWPTNSDKAEQMAALVQEELNQVDGLVKVAFEPGKAKK